MRTLALLALIAGAVFGQGVAPFDPRVSVVGDVTTAPSTYSSTSFGQFRTAAPFTLFDVVATSQGPTANVLCGFGWQEEVQ